MTSDFYHDHFEILKNHIQAKNTDESIIRKEPIVFSSVDGNNKRVFIICSPVIYSDHPCFIQDLSIILGSFYEVFKDVQFPKNKTQLNQTVSKIAVFNTSPAYETLIKYGLPAFIGKWAKTEKKGKIVPIKKWKARKLLSCFTIEDIFSIFFQLYLFNYHSVKENTQYFLKHLLAVGSSDKVVSMTCSSSSGKNTVLKMPKYSNKPFKKSVLRRFEQQSKLH